MAVFGNQRIGESPFLTHSWLPPFFSREEVLLRSDEVRWYAFANRNCVTQSLRGALKLHLGAEIDVDVIYDVCHNIARVEEHVVHGSNCNCCVHRKGARSFGGESDELSEEFGE